MNASIIFRGSLIFAVLLTCAQAGVYVFVHDEFSLAAINDIAAAVSSLAAVLGMLYGAIYSSRYDRKLGTAWLWFALAMGMWMAGDILWAVYDIGLGEVPYPSVADIFYLANYLFFFVGILKYPRLHNKAAGDTVDAVDASWIWLDVFIIMFSAGGIFGNFLIGPALQDLHQPWLAVLVNAAYPLADLLLIAAITLMIFLPRSPLWLRPIYLMLAGQVLSVIADSYFAYQTINETYASSAFVNILFSIGPLVLMMSGLSQAVAARQVLFGQKTMPLSQAPSLVIIRLITPFVWLFFAFLLLTLGSNVKQVLSRTAFSLWLGAVILLIAARQMLSTLDNRRLAGKLQKMNNTLERRVEDRTAALFTSNMELQREMEERVRVENMLREREEKLTHFGLHDALTGLPNRSLLIDRLTHSIQRHRRHPQDAYAVLFLDFDSFKVVNDSLGHPAGDQLLVQIGQRLLLLMRAEDTVARLGGDEFVILIQGYQNVEFVNLIANRVLTSMKEPFPLAGKPIYISASIGIVIASAAHETAIEVLRDADMAMYEAKSQGRARYVLFQPDLHVSAINRQALDSDLREALKNDEFFLLYQPIVELESGRIYGFEALIRWQHPTRGLMPPSEFISVAESNGFIDHITRWTLQRACLQLGDWQARFPALSHLNMSVNLSPISLRQPELLRWVRESLRAASLSPTCLSLEIVENIFIQDPDLAGRTFKELRGLGVQVSLDDFGTGYSSLGYINQYPIDTIKIDRSFVSRLTRAGEVDAVVRAIIRLAHDLNFKIVAEGIETREQLDFIKEAGCQYGQGFLFHKPLDIDAIDALLLNVS